jgi:hypothetical protein
MPGSPPLTSGALTRAHAHIRSEGGRNDEILELVATFDGSRTQQERGGGPHPQPQLALFTELYRRLECQPTAVHWTAAGMLSVGTELLGLLQRNGAHDSPSVHSACAVVWPPMYGAFVAGRRL